MGEAGEAVEWCGVVVDRDDLVWISFRFSFVTTYSEANCVATCLMKNRTREGWLGGRRVCYCWPLPTSFRLSTRLPALCHGIQPKNDVT